MKYLILSAKYSESCIQDEFNGEVELSDLELPNDLLQKINIWHSSYKKFIPMPDNERSFYIIEMEELDKIGLEIANQLQLLIPGGAKVKYFSEGKLAYLSI